jgi:hypothetical protein
MNGIQEVISKLEAQRSAIERALAALHDVDGTGESPSRRRPGRPKAAVAAEPSQPAQEARKRGRVTPEGRKRLAEAMKRRWAVKRAASAAKKSLAKKKVTAKKTAPPAAA